MKANLEFYPERGMPQRVLISPWFMEICPRPMIEMIQPIVDVYGIEALGFVHLPNNPLKAWALLHGIEILEWVSLQSMHSLEWPSLQAFRPTLLLASEYDDALWCREARKQNLPALSFSGPDSHANA
jgi:hypothetical protein